MFTCAAPTSWHSKVLKEVLGSSQATILVILARTAHLGMAFAAAGELDIPTSHRGSFSIKVVALAMGS